MGVFMELFGKSPRVAVIEAFSENPDDELSVPEIVLMTDVSRRAAYMHVKRLKDEGIIIRSRKKGKCVYYRFNENDQRGDALAFLESTLVLGRIEKSIKIDQNIPLQDPFPQYYHLPDHLFVTEAKSNIDLNSWTPFIDSCEKEKVGILNIIHDHGDEIKIPQPLMRTTFNTIALTTSN